MNHFHELLETSGVAHGHLCPGQVVGVRMGTLGCRLISLDEPTRRDQIKKLIVCEGGYVYRPCAEGAYFSNAREITWADMNWAPSEVSELSAPHDHGHHFEKPGKRRAAVIALR